MADVDQPAGAPSKTSDLPVRVASAIVMVAIAGTALWLGGWVWTAFVALVGLGVFWEWSRLAFAITDKLAARAAWLIGGVAYIGIACYVLFWVRIAEPGPQLHPDLAILQTIVMISIVIGVDVGAYFVGRLVGGPKIAPQISPSKTWSGLIGGAGGAFLALMGAIYAGGRWIIDEPDYLAQFLRYDGAAILAGLAVVGAIVAQAGDFFESWMKRTAGVKDSSNLIPGHGGLFDRFDGLLAICFMFGLIALVLGAMNI